MIKSETQIDMCPSLQKTLHNLFKKPFHFIRSVPLFCNLAGILNGLFVGVGSGSGSILGGVLISKVGIRVAYRLFAAFLIVVILFFLACHWQEQSTDEDGDDSKSAYRALPSQEEDLGE